MYVVFNKSRFVKVPTEQKPLNQTILLTCEQTLIYLGKETYEPLFI